MTLRPFTIDQRRLADLLSARAAAGDAIADASESYRDARRAASIANGRVEEGLREGDVPIAKNPAEQDALNRSWLGPVYAEAERANAELKAAEEAQRVPQQRFNLIAPLADACRRYAEDRGLLRSGNAPAALAPVGVAPNSQHRNY